MATAHCVATVKAIQPTNQLLDRYLPVFEATKMVDQREFPQFLSQTSTNVITSLSPNYQPNHSPTHILTKTSITQAHFHSSSGQTKPSLVSNLAYRGSEETSETRHSCTFDLRTEDEGRRKMLVV